MSTKYILTHTHLNKMVPIKSKKKKVFISFKEVDITHHHLNFFNILKNQRLHLHYIHVFTELFHRSSMLHGTSAVVQRVDSYWRFFNYFNNLFFRNFSFRQIHCKCSKKETLLFTGASHVSATPLEHHLSMVSPTLLTYHMKVNSGDMEL